MRVDVVVDVGNSRVKWGRCEPDRVAAVASLPPDDPADWQRQLADWGLGGPLAWAVSGVHPARCGRLCDWLRQRGDMVWLLEKAGQLPLAVQVGHPDKVGIDRLLNAVAAIARLRGSGRRPKKGRPAVLVDVGTAVTVDLLSPEGAFLGGAILPGRRLMAAALHQHTALLPLVSCEADKPPPVGQDTAAAIEAGIHHAVAGGVNQLIRWQLGSHYPRVDFPTPPAIFLTGGDAARLRYSLDSRAELWPEMTLEGIRLAAEAQP